MMLHQVVLLAALPFLASTTPVVEKLHVRATNAAPKPTISGLFTLTAASRNRTINHLKVEALGNLYVGSSGPATYCPEFLGEFCPPGDETVFYPGLDLDVLVPGGQQTYVAPDGLVSYTRAHTTFMPIGSYTNGWSWTPYNSSSYHYPGSGRHWYHHCPFNDTRYDCDHGTGIYTFKSPDEEQGGMMACPPPASAAQNGFDIYGITPGFVREGCVRLDGLRTHPYTGLVQAWQYI
ncbi:hypothetical protein MMC24_006820 [Lignoscripta atroalba]|nr:hypothetical protein [Lignoscripta atroalba]